MTEQANLNETIRAVFGTFALWYNTLTAQVASQKSDCFVSDWQAEYAYKHREEIYRNHISDYEPICNVQTRTD